MKKLITTLTTTLALTLFTSSAFAAAPAFADADANKDGVVSLAEAKVALPDMDEGSIVAADVNGDGGLSEEEYTALTTS